MIAATQYHIGKMVGVCMAASLVSFISVTNVPSARAADSLLDPVRARLQTARETLGETSDTPPIARAERLLATGDPSGALREVRAKQPDLLGLGRLERQVALSALLRVHDYTAAHTLVLALRDAQAGSSTQERENASPDEARDRSLLYEWSFDTGDHAWIERVSQERLEHSDTTSAIGRAASVIDRLAAGDLRLELLDPDGAEPHYRAALRFASTPRERMEAWTGLAKVAQKRLDWDGSLDPLSHALSEDVLDPAPLLALGDTRIRLGETEAAIAADQLALELDPFSETAHYIIGNGYTAKNYTELFAAYPGAFADSSGRLELSAADTLLESGDADAARMAYEAIAKRNPGWADVHVRLGSLAFSRASYETALEHFQTGLSICPEYGRAHHGIAKSLEQLRVAWNIHREEDEKVFAEATMPEIPNIEQLVVNWFSLSSRHQKRVALSVAPWQRFIPVLVAGGHTYYIKPIYQLLSEAPGLKTLRDLRIDYDSRLWDDVRGCGGYHTVTGIEDVERTIFHNYDTVLHELTHQVHGVLPPAMARDIEELYRQAKERDEGTGNAFLSRYAGGSVWEYFAEGAHALSHPRRDRFDTREIVLERLEAIDPALRDLVVRVQDEVALEPCYPIAYANRGHDELEQGDPEAAIRAYRDALVLDATEPNALGSLVYALQVDGRAADAAVQAREAADVHPDDGNLAVRRASADWHAGSPLEEVIVRLAGARPKIREQDSPTVDLELGRMYWIHGDGSAALQSYDRALAVQADMPEAIWGRAMAHALEQEWDEAWIAYDEAVRSRTGIVQLRCDYALDLMRAGETDRAAEQIEEARLLDGTDPTVRALDAWLILVRGDAKRAREIAATVTREFDWCVLASIVEARAALELGDTAAAEATARSIRAQMAVNHPRFVFRPQWGRYDEVATFPAIERALIESEGALPLP